MEQHKIDRFYKDVEDIESLNKSDLSGSLKDYFQHRTNVEEDTIIWIKDPGSKIRTAVIIAANKHLGK